MWHFGIWFSTHGGVGWVVGLHELKGLFQPMILWFYEQNKILRFNFAKVYLTLYSILTLG